MKQSKKLSLDEVKHIAKLADLPLSDDELEKFDSQLSETIEFINHLSEVNTEGVSPTSQVTGKTNELREDEVTASLSQEEALKNAEKKHNGYFVSTIEWN